MEPTKIETSREFFEHVVEKDVADFINNALDLRAAYHACTSLLSMRDWIAREYANKSWAYSGSVLAAFAGVGSLQSALEQLDQRFAITTDVANASKHMVLDPKRKPRTNLWGNANTVVQNHCGAIGSAPLGAAPIGGSLSAVVVRIDNSHHDVLDCVTAVHGIWKQLMTENSW